MNPNDVGAEVCLRRIRAAILEIARLSQMPEDPGPLGPEEIELAIGEPLSSFEVAVSNRNSRIYAISTVSGRQLIAKQGVSKAWRQLECEYRHYEAVARLKLPAVRALRPVATLAQRQSYIVDEAAGDSLAHLFSRFDIADRLLEAVRHAARTLRALHERWQVSTQAVPVTEYLDDFGSALGAVEVLPAVETALAALGNLTVAVGQPWLDYDPVNLFWDESNLSLIDPPEETCSEPLLWDLATLLVGLRRALWKNLARFPWRVWSPLLGRCRAVAVSTYFGPIDGSSPGAHPERGLLPILELQRICQLLVWQCADPELWVQRGPGSWTTRRVAIGLLRGEQRRLIRTLKKLHG